MSLSVGIVGLPNVGKSTTFNALTKTQNAEAANYPFCTIEPNKAVVPVPDPRLTRIAEINRPPKVTPATVEFFDIAGLVKGASQGEGLGNQFLGHIRETAAIVHVVRCFDDDNVVHVGGGADPVSDMDIICTELALADMQQLERKIERLSKQAKTDKAVRGLLGVAERLVKHLGEGKPVSIFQDEDLPDLEALRKEMQFLTDKPVTYVANVDEAGLLEDNQYIRAVRDYAAGHDAEVIKLCAKLEEEMAGLSDEERQEFLTSMNVEESGLEQVIHKAYKELGLISFFTAGPKEARAWELRAGSTAPQAAGQIHTDFERGFIRAEVIAYDAYVAHGGEAGAKAAGQMRVEGRDYIVKDGDVIYFRFNV